MAEPLVHLDRASVHFRSKGSDVIAVHEATAAVHAGDLIAVTGPSGSGKSTLLGLMAGLDLPTTGKITWPAVGAREQLRPRHIGMAFQAHSLLPALTIAANVELPLLLLGEENGARKRALDLLSVLGLGALANRLPGELSGGQIQRAAIARAMITRPDLVLADEPTGQLDQATGQQLVVSILDAIDSSAAALVIATHDPAIAGRMAIQWRMRHGQLNTAEMADAP